MRLRPDLDRAFLEFWRPSRWERLLRRLPGRRGKQPMPDLRLRTLEALRQVSVHECFARLQGTERQAEPGRLGRHEAQVFSQSGEDGVLLEIFRRIGTERRTFVEFGAGDGGANNTTLLLQSGWRGVWVEAADEGCRQIATALAGPIRDGSLTLHQAYLTVENVSDELRAAGVDEAPDLLSIDVDGNDYWLWRELSWLRARVVIVEYNALYPPPLRWVMPYDPDHRWRGDTHFGASLESLADLGAELGYALVGCTLAGTNAFFVRRELAEGRFAAPFTAENHYEPARYFLIGNEGYRRALRSVATGAPGTA